MLSLQCVSSADRAGLDVMEDIRLHMFLECEKNLGKDSS